MNNKLLSTLLALGLSENEAYIYLASLAQGASTIQSLAKASGINRTTVYGVVESLRRKGLMAIEQKGLKKLYAAEHPDQLELILDAQRNKLQKTLPDFEKLYNSQEREYTFKVFEGKESVKSMYTNLVTSLGPKDFYWAIGSHESWVGIDPDFFRKLDTKFIKRRIPVRLLLRRSKNSKNYKQQITSYDIKLFATDKEITSDVIITPNVVIIHKHHTPTTVIQIKNQSILETHK